MQLAWEQQGQREQGFPPSHCESPQNPSDTRSGYATRKLNQYEPDRAEAVQIHVSIRPDYSRGHVTSNERLA